MKTPPSSPIASDRDRASRVRALWKRESGPRAGQRERDPAGSPTGHGNREITRAAPRGYRRPGPSPRDLDRLERGQIGSLRFAGRYHLERLAARGDTSRVFVGRDLLRGREVAVEILHDRHCGDPQVLARFLRKARLTAHLRHENIVEVHDFGSTREGVVYSAMEHLEGETLRASIRRRPGLPWAWVRAIMLQICAGLAALHEAGVVHRDLTPSNCLLVGLGWPPWVKLIDLGRATLARNGAASARDRRGAIVGTPRYMPPEQARGAAVDVRRDVYAAGIILGELLTGRVPFRGDTLDAVLAAQSRMPWPTLAQLAGPDVVVDPSIHAVFERAVQPEPDDRFASIDAMAAAIRAASPDEPAPAPSEGSDPTQGEDVWPLRTDGGAGLVDTGSSPRVD